MTTWIRRASVPVARRHAGRFTFTRVGNGRFTVSKAAARHAGLHEMRFGLAGAAVSSLDGLKTKDSTASHPATGRLEQDPPIQFDQTPSGPDVEAPQSLASRPARPGFCPMIRAQILGQRCCRRADLTLAGDALDSLAKLIRKATVMRFIRSSYCRD